MNVIFIGIRRFEFFTQKKLEQINKILVISKDEIIPEWLDDNTTIVRVSEIYDKTTKLMSFSINDCIKKLKPLILNENDFRVFCNQESYLEIANEIRQYFGLYDHMGGRMKNFRDKLLMKKIVSNANLRVPKYISLDQHVILKGYKYLCEVLGKRFVIKPCSSVGSKGVLKIFTETDFNYFVEHIWGDGCTYEAEEYIDGDLYEFDFVIDSGVEIYSSISRYSCPMVEIQEGKSLGSIMMTRDSKLHDIITKFGRECGKALQADNGCFHMELFICNNETVFLEIAARSPGLLTVPAYKSWEGINMYDLELSLQIGDYNFAKSDSTSNHISKPAFFVVFPKISGIVDTLNTPKINGEFIINWAVKEGEKLEISTNNVDFAGVIFVQNKNEIEAERDFTYLTEHFTPIKYKNNI